jgi:hypothetical protein
MRGNDKKIIMLTRMLKLKIFKERKIVLDRLTSRVETPRTQPRQGGPFGYFEANTTGTRASSSATVARTTGVPGGECTRRRYTGNSPSLPSSLVHSYPPRLAQIEFVHDPFKDELGVGSESTSNSWTKTSLKGSSRAFKASAWARQEVMNSIESGSL